MFKWVMASLLLLNGGALVALLQTPEGRPLLVSSGTYFVAGAFFSVMSGISAMTFVLFLTDLSGIATFGIGKEESGVRKKVSRLLDMVMLGLCVGCMTASILLFVQGTASVRDTIAGVDKVAHPRVG
jgi:hypothetical protein